ncbi:MAG: hypothetical protein AB2L20_07575 [Mangrovibacterium sp.]
MTTETLKQQCIEHLREIAEPGRQVCLMPEQAAFLEVDLWDQADLPEEGGQDGR